MKTGFCLITLWFLVMSLPIYSMHSAEDRELSSKLIAAVKKNDAAVVQEIPVDLRYRAAIICDQYGASALHYATEGDRSHLIDLLLAGNGKPDIKDPSGMTPLHWAASGGNSAAVKALLAHGAKVSQPDKSGWTPLHIAGNGAVARLLINAKADPEAKGQRGITPLHRATERDLLDVVEVLMLAGAKPQRAGWKDGWKKPSPRTSQELRNFLAKSGDATIDLFAAVKARKVQEAKKALKKGAHVNTADLEGNTPLHIAAMTNQPVMIVLLLSYGAQADKQNTAGLTPVELAFAHGAMNAIQAFVRAGGESKSR